ncbi:MAG: pirin family protein [Verrucomicrobia bacterium]|nr:pirin family protein [Verrucomicrobiota bacterium]
MTEIRKINQVWQSKPTTEGAGVRLHRAFGYDQVPRFDPFLLLDDFRGDDPADYLKGFPWHPHRGIETITYVLAGEVEHGDSMGNKGVITPGDVQWMTAGSGIVHQEMPQGDEKGRMYGFQLWANLPASHKMMEPRYRDVKEAQIPEVSLAQGVKVKIICGRVNGAKGPVTDIVTDPEYLEVSVPAGAEFHHAIQRGHTALAYVIAGEGYFDPERNAYAHEVVGSNYFNFDRRCVCGDRSIILYWDGDEVVVAAPASPVRFLLISGRPIGEPVAWYGPIVMNTQKELQLAFEEYQEGTFIKHARR